MSHRKKTRKSNILRKKSTRRRRYRGGRLNVDTLLDATIQYAKNAGIQYRDTTDQNTPDELKKTIEEDIGMKVDETIEPSANKEKDNTRQITHALPYFLQIYEKMYTAPDNMKKDTQVGSHKVSNRMIMEFVMKQIRSIQKKHPHPELYETLYYYLGLFDLQISFEFLDAYINKVYEKLSYKDKPGGIKTIVEKQLGNTGSFQEWNADTKNRGYRVYTKRFGQTSNPIMNANSDLLALATNPFRPYTPIVDTFDTLLKLGDEGRLEYVDNIPSEVPKTSKKTGEKSEQK